MIHPDALLARNHRSAPRSQSPQHLVTRRRIAFIIGFVAIGAGCERRGGEPAARDASGLLIHRTERATIRRLERDTLSESARILRLAPEPDGDAIAVLFTDTARGIEAGLSLSARRSDVAQLLWPDSVVTLWWSGPHELSFTTRTGRDVRVVVDVHAAALDLVESARPAAPPAGPPPAADSIVARAQLFIDSLHVQPGGVPQRSDVRYIVSAVRVAPGGRHAAFYVLGLDRAGRRVNPAWYALDIATGAAAAIEEVIGSPADLPEEGAGWTEGGVFIYARDLEIREAVIQSG